MTQFYSYTEFAARFDVAQQLHLQGADLSLVEFYNLDVISLIVVVLFLFISVFIYTCKVLFCCLFGKKRAMKTQKVD